MIVNPHTYEMQQLAQDMTTECKREIRDLEGLKEHVDEIVARLNSGEIPTMRETELLVLMKNALVNHRSLITAIKEQAKTYWDK